MFPLAKKQIGGYRFLQPTFYSDHHLGTDYKANMGTNLYAPFSGQIIKQVTGSQGGRTIHFKPENQNVIMRFMHLDEYKRSQGDRLKEGDIMAITGNSGSATSGAHLHLDISKGAVNINNINNFLDPETFNWRSGGEGESMTDEELRNFAEAIVTIRTGQPEKNEVNYLVGRIRGGLKPQDYAKDVLRDGIFPAIYRAASDDSSYSGAGDGEFWLKWFKDNPNKYLEEVSKNWYDEFVKPSKSDLEKLTKVAENLRNENEALGAEYERTRKAMVELSKDLDQYFCP